MTYTVTVVHIETGEALEEISFDFQWEFWSFVRSQNIIHQEGNRAFVAIPKDHVQDQEA